MELIKHKNKYYIKSDGGYREVIASSNPDLIKEGIASIDDEFVKEYVKNPVEEVRAEYYRVDYFDDGGIHTTEYDLKPKLSSNGSISIKPIEETWTNIYEKWFERAQEDYKNNKKVPIQFHNWLEENYEVPKKKQ